MSIERAHDLMVAGGVKRHHNYPIIGEQTIADHTWRVWMLADELFGPLHPMQTRWIMLHDAIEWKTGDIPANMKWNMGEMGISILHRVEAAERQEKNLQLPTLTTGKLAECKVCDYLELLMFCVEQRNLGNRNAGRPFDAVIPRVEKMINTSLHEPWDEESEKNWMKAQNLFFDIRRDFSAMGNNGSWMGGYYGQ